MASVPPRLITDIKAGNCVAFVGAGFSAPAVPQWKQLLAELNALEEIGPSTRSRVEALLMGGSGRDLEAAAQTLRDDCGEATFREAMRRFVGNPPINPSMQRRLELLRGIPFRAVLTTNFDGLLAGSDPGPDAYMEVLRPQDHRWWDRRFWDTHRPGPSVVKLHGSVEDPSQLVFTRRDYRRRLYSSSAYSTFLRAVMSTTTVLYLGFSFNDAYLNELRSEILSLLDHRDGDDPVAYALVNDTSDAEAEYSRKHEGIHAITYDTIGGDYSGFDRHLEAIHRQTNPRLLLGELLKDKRIVWVDPSKRSPQFGMKFLQEAASTSGGKATIDRAAKTDEGLAKASGADLIVTHWGHGLGPNGESVAEYLLGEVRRRQIEVPVMVFASGAYADANKSRSLRLGATSYEYSWEGLYQEISRIFAPGSKST